MAGGNPSGSEWQDWSSPSDYNIRGAHVRGFRVLWALEDTDALRLVEASHKSALPPPSPELAAQIPGALVPLPLRAGDLVLAAATTLLAWHPAASQTATGRVLELVICFDEKLARGGSIGSGGASTYESELGYFLSNDRWIFDDNRYVINPEYYLSDDSVEPAPPPMPPWFAELDPAQQAVVGGHAGMAAVHSDGRNAHVKAQAQEQVTMANTRVEAEKWFFDTHGYFIIPDIMDEEVRSYHRALINEFSGM